MQSRRRHGRELAYHGWRNAGALTITGTVSNPTKASSPVIDRFLYCRLGNELIGFYTYLQTASTGAANGSGDYYWTLPSGLVVDTGVHPVDTENTGFSGTGGDFFAMPVVGRAWLNTGTSGSNQHIVYNTFMLSTTEFSIMRGDEQGMPGSGTGFASNDVWSMTAQLRIPIVGWGMYR